MQNLQKPHTRADYRQLLDLTVIFIGENPFSPKPIRFSPPIAVSSARFMARIISCLEIHMFALTGEFVVAPHILTSVRDLNLFFVTIHLKPWYTATHPASAPRTGLILLKNIVSDIAGNSFKSHLCYRNNTTVGLAFFDSEITAEEKREM
ncbi:hypothetical protein FOCC_FOCC015078 [Frankliniella occidentalis]|nr:hypothetical protein FOCC_FOCC015078 [Frankliniella occidentalis]